MKGFLKTLPVAVLVIAGAAGRAQAGGISGSIQFTGGTINDTNSLMTSTTFESFNGTGAGGLPVVQFGDSGTYGGVPATTPVTFFMFTFTGPGTILPTTLWQFSSGGDTYSFVADTITSVTATAHNIPGVGEQDFLNIVGSGVASITGPGGFTPTRGTFTITESGPPGVSTAFNFAESVVVPEPSVLALVGMAVVPFAWRYVRKAGRR